jgi:hypothetical protein
MTRRKNALWHRDFGRFCGRLCVTSFFLEPIVQAVMYKGRRALQRYSNDENRIGKYGGSEKRVGSGFKAVCDRIVPRSENDDHHDRFALHRVNKLRRLVWWREADSRRLHQH